jgi:hypothetical protein
MEPKKPGKRKRPWLRRLVLAGLTLAAYPTFVLTYTWSHVLQSPLPGGRHGPLDAYRHTLASAVVAHTLDARVILLVNGVMERHGRRSNAMDIHNNLIGAGIGSRATCGSMSEKRAGSMPRRRTRPSGYRRRIGKRGLRGEEAAMAGSTRTSHGLSNAPGSERIRLSAWRRSGGPRAPAR